MVMYLQEATYAVRRDGRVLAWLDQADCVVLEKVLLCSVRPVLSTGLVWRKDYLEEKKW